MRDLTEWRALLVHQPLQRISPVLHRQLRSLVGRRRLLNLRRPVAFNEKLNWRCLYDRRPLLAGTCDKLAMKQFARDHGPAELRAPRTLWSGTDLAELAELAEPGKVDLTGRWVLKPNHRSGLVHFGSGPVTARDVPRLTELTRGWLREHLASVEGEWAYGQARACFLVEEWVGHDRATTVPTVPTGPTVPTVPTDYKFFTFGGDVRIVVVDSSRYGEHRRTVYDANWQRQDVRIERPSGPAEPPPAELPAMLDIAQRLGRPFDFMRVDLYALDGEVWFSELTPYPGGGFGVVRPWSFDVELGRAWTLPTADETS